MSRVLDPNTPGDSPLTREDVHASADYEDLRTPKLRAGDPAADFALPLFDFGTGHARATGRTIRLGDFAGRRPVALVFGSYT